MSFPSSEVSSCLDLVGVCMVCAASLSIALKDGISSLSMEMLGTCSKGVAYKGTIASPLKRLLMLSRIFSIFCPKLTNKPIILALEIGLVARLLSNSLASLMTSFGHLMLLSIFQISLNNSFILVMMYLESLFSSFNLCLGRTNLVSKKSTLACRSALFAAMVACPVLARLVLDH